MKTGKFYKHKRNTDVAILVHSVTKIGDMVSLDVQWINVVATPFLIAVAIDRIDIQAHLVRDWEEISIDL
jgi:hypothetical protein